MARLFERHGQHQVAIYDKFKPEYADAMQREAINRCDLVFISVPTPTGPDGMSCDLSAVEESVAWVDAPICIRSTIVPGTCDRLSRETGKALAFSPEYLGESSFHAWREDGACGFLIIGGPAEIADLVVSTYRDCLEEGTRYHRTTALSAELCKYMENCFLATKVAFMNQFYDIAQSLGADFDEVRELWLVDPRIGESHTVVTEERGFRGRCLPKDIAALVAAMSKHGGAPMLEAVRNYNLQVCLLADRRRNELKQSGDGAATMRAQSEDAGQKAKTGP
jgi:UDPglucose 6-dehydrogenase